MTIAQLGAFRPESQYFIGIDSDGCVFDSMSIKHRECFCPAFIDHFELQPIAGCAREAWEFINLHSRMRGYNRFLCLIAALDYLRNSEAVRAMGFAPMSLPGLEAWVKRESKLGNSALEAEAAKEGNPDLARALAWSIDVNASVKRIVRGVPPFAACRAGLESLRRKADLLVVSQTPMETVEAEWVEHGIRGLIRGIAGQEAGTKAESIRAATEGRYEKRSVLMIGDSWGDLEAAREGGVLFYPIIPGRAEESWERLIESAAPLFFEGRYSGDFSKAIVREFEAALPEVPAFVGRALVRD